MNIREANAVTHLLEHIGLLPATPGHPVGEDDARRAAALLAERAGKALMMPGALSAEQVHQQWPGRIRTAAASPDTGGGRP